MEPAEILETIDQMRKGKELRRKYEDRIKHRKDGRQEYIYINRMQIVAVDEEALYRKLYDIEYGEKTIRWQIFFPCGCYGKETIHLLQQGLCRFINKNGTSIWKILVSPKYPFEN